MAFPLKSGADLYNQQLIRAAIWNYSAEILDPKEYATGLMYFNTNPGSNLYQKLRFRTSTEWKTIAFEEDLDVANNAEFKALEDKVKLLAGEVDTDAIISNMKEVSNFLAGFAEDANLMSVLDGKLDKSGGTINGTITSSGQIILSSGYSNKILLRSNSKSQYISFQTEDGTVYGYLGTRGDDILRWKGSTVLHDGNIYEKNLGLNELSAFRFFTVSGDSLAPKNESIISGFTVAIDGNNSFKKQLAFGHDSQPKLYARSQDTGSWSDWKTIAFTDSTVEAAKKLVNSNGNALIYSANSNILYDGKGRVLMDYADDWQVFGEWTGYKTGIRGSSIEMAVDGKIATFINTTGNVGIGTTTNISSRLTLAASTTDEPTIAVDNHCKILGISNQRNDWGSRTILESGWNSTTGDYLYLRLPSSAAESSYLFMQRENGGRFGVDTNAPQAKFHVNGDIVANGTIACKGIAAEGSEVGMGTVDKKVLYISSSTTQQTFSLTHGLNAREITVCVFEITSTGTNMILTDVEITGDNTISVSFGNPPTDNHMVVVMG